MSEKTIRFCLSKAVQLKQVSDTPDLDCQLILAHVLEKDRTYLYTWPERQVGSELFERFEQLIVRRQQGEPVAYLVGYRDFWSLRLLVDESTLIPRPETELLVETALAKMEEAGALSVLDLGTGTGAIALAIAKERPQCSVIGVDFQTQAIELAQKNQQLNGISNVNWKVSDWFSSVQEQSFQLIVTNPPYIDPKDPHLLQGDVRFEPHTALVADDEGLSDIDKIIDQAPNFLSKKGWILIEHGYNQEQQVKTKLLDRGFTQVFTRHDFSGHPRISGGCW